MRSAIFLFINVEFTDSSSKMSKTVQKNINRFIEIQYVIAFWSAILEPPFLISLIIYFQFRFVISIFQNPLTNPPSVGRSVRIPVNAKTITKVWNSSRVFFSYIIYYKILSVFLQRVFRSAKFIFGTIYFKKLTNDYDNSHITAILQWNINIAATFHL